MNSVFIALIIQKVMLTMLNLLMVKKPKRKYHRIDNDLHLHKKKSKEDDKKMEVVITYKFTPCDKMSLAIGYFVIFAVIAGSIFYSLL